MSDVLVSLRVQVCIHDAGFPGVQELMLFVHIGKLPSRLHLEVGGHSHLDSCPQRPSVTPSPL